MSSLPELKLDWCSHRAAKFAVEHWHYSQRMPMPPLVKIGVWEGGDFIGAIVFGRGASPHAVKFAALSQLEGAELVRVALTRHAHPVTRIVSIALKMLRRHSPGTRIVMSYADPKQGHLGKIYQAGNWVYLGKSPPSPLYFRNGRWVHPRSATGVQFGKAVGLSLNNLPKRIVPGKHRYAFPLDRSVRSKLEALRQPYPQHVEVAA
jgi:hypothetical protein